MQDRRDVFVKGRGRTGKRGNRWGDQTTVHGCLSEFHRTAFQHIGQRSRQVITRWCSAVTTEAQLVIDTPTVDDPSLVIQNDHGRCAVHTQGTHAGMIGILHERKDGIQLNRLTGHIPNGLLQADINGNELHTARSPIPFQRG